MAKDDKATKKAAAKKLAEKKAAAKKLAEKKAAAKKAAEKLAEKAADKKAAAKKAAKKLADKVAAKKLPAKKAKSPTPARAKVPAAMNPVAEVETTEVATSVEAAGVTRRELLVHAGQLGIVGRHRMSKVDLEAAIAAH